MSHSFKKSVISGLLWSLVESGMSQGIRFIIGIILARLLVPEMFGLIAMLLVFITFSEILVDSGFGTALIQKQSITELEICSIFYFNIFIGLLAAALLVFSAPVIAEFYSQPILTPLMRALSIILIFNSFGMIQANLLVKKVDFKSLTILSSISSIASGILGIILAFMGYDVWSLVIQQISLSLIRNIFLWFYSTWRPAILFSVDSLGRMLRFGLPILGTGILNRTSEGVYNMVIGKLFSATELGVFSRANQIQAFPSFTLARLVGRVTFPVYSKMQHDPIMFKLGLRKTFIMISFLVFPMMFGLMVVAKPLILVMLTEKWEATIPYLQLLSFVGVMYPFEWIRQQAIQAAGRPDLSFKIEIIKKIILFACIATMWYWGILAIISGMIFASLVSFLLNIHYISIVTPYSTKEQFLDMLPYAIISIVMVIITFSMMYLLSNSNPFYQLVASSFSGILFYIGITYFFRTSAINTILNELKRTMKNNVNIH